MLGQVVPAEELIPEGAGIDLPYTLFLVIDFSFECKPVPQFLLPRVILLNFLWSAIQSEGRHGVEFLHQIPWGYQGILVKTRIVSYMTSRQIMLWSRYKNWQILKKKPVRKNDYSLFDSGSISGIRLSPVP
jgi:hypothetical protein